MNEAGVVEAAANNIVIACVAAFAGGFIGVVFAAIIERAWRRWRGGRY